MKKIMFCDRYGLTQAVIDGRKTMTRRLIPSKFVDSARNGFFNVCIYDAQKAGRAYRVGEIVAVAQSYQSLNESGFVAPEQCEHTCEDSKGYENKMYVRADLMPYQIQITDIRIERLQDIKNNDCTREGIFRDDIDPEFPFVFDVFGKQTSRWRFPTRKEAFAALINRRGVGGPGTWERNPLVFVYSFKLIK